MDKITAVFDDTQMQDLLDGLIGQLDNKESSGLTMLLQVAASKVEAWAKDNAEWTDRTGAARQRLHGECFWESENIVVCAIMHQVDYGMWLELAHQRKYAILEKSLEQHKQEILDSVVELIESYSIK